MKNKELRDYARIMDVRLWRIAEKLNIADSNFSRLLRHELPDEKKEEVMKIIDELAKNREV